MNTGREEKTLAGHANGVWSVAVFADGEHVITGGVDDTAKIWEASTGRELEL